MNVLMAAMAVVIRFVSTAWAATLVTVWKAFHWQVMAQAVQVKLTLITIL